MVEKVSKKRLDVYIHDNGLAESREKAKVLIMEGKVYVNGQKEDKPGTMIKDDAIVECKTSTMQYVSRGGYKIEKAADAFKIDFTDMMCADIGSSTGGFTDYMLKNGAKLVYAIDSGTNQLDYRLRIDKRVVTLENTNARYLTPDIIRDTPLDIVTIDVSFISLTMIIPVAMSILKEDGKILMLIKPQFEAGKEKVGKNGVVKDKLVHIEVVKTIIDFCYKINLNIEGLDYSPIKGPAGNIEFLLYVSKRHPDGSFFSHESSQYNDEHIKEIVECAHAELDK